MAGGSKGGYRERSSRDGDGQLEISRKKELLKGQSWGRIERRREISDGENPDGTLDRHLRVKEKGTENGTSRSSSTPSNSSSGSGHENGVHSTGRLTEREPGELSCGSGSDDADVIQTEAVARGSRLTPTKKRKFSPIVWDRDDGKSTNKASSVDAPLPPPPPLPLGVVPLSRTELTNAEEKSNLLIADNFDHMEEDEDYYPARNISASRWADRNNVSEDEETEDFGKDPRSEAVAEKLLKKVPSPELGEVVAREGSEESASRSSGLSGEQRDRESDGEKNSYMDLDASEFGRDRDSVESETDSDTKDDSLRTLEPIQPPQRSINMLQGCRSVDEFERMNKIDEGTYGVVYRAKDKKSGEVVALKKVKMEKEREGFPLTSLREINILLSLHHPSIVDVKEVVVGNSLDSIFMVMEYMEHDLKALMETMKQPFSQSEVKCLMLQLLEGVKHLHDNWVLHR